MWICILKRGFCLWSSSAPTITIGGRSKLCCMALSCPIPLLPSGWTDLLQIKVLDHRFEFGLEIWLWYVYRVYPKCLDKLQERVRHTETRKEVMYVRKTLFELWAPILARPEDFYICVGKLKHRSAFSYNLKWRDISPMYLWCPPNHSQPPEDFWKNATVHDETFPWVHWFRWRTFCVFVLKCNLINDKKSNVIKLGTCIVTE